MTLNTAPIQAAVAILQAGGLVGLPTETVYGLAADASNEAAIARIYAAKGRPADHPLIVHLAGVAGLAQWAKNIPPAAFKLAEAFWPGPLTLILQKQPWVSDLLTAGQPTVGLRVPAHPVALAVLQAFGGGLAAPSANQFTHVSPTTAAAVLEELAGRVDLVLEGGECDVGLESTILDLSGATPTILRPGMLSRDAIEAVLGVKVAVRAASTVRVPGQHVVHYAPSTPCALITEAGLAGLSGTSALITHRRDVSVPPGVTVHVLSSDPQAYAHDLYRVLRELDHQGFQQIAILRVPDSPEWEAIQDRLQKAAGRS